MQDAQVTETNDVSFEDEPDKFFGVFQAIGEDVGVNPFYLRVLFIAGLFFSAAAALAAYAALGAVVVLSRLLFPKPRIAAVPMIEQAQPQVATAAELEREPELIAA